MNTMITHEESLISKDVLAFLLLVFFMLILLKKHSLYNAFKVFFSNRSGIEFRDISIVNTAVIQFFFIGLFFYIFKSLHHEQNTVWIPLFKLFVLLIVRFFLDFFIIKSLTDSPMKTYLLLKEQSRVFLALIFLIPVFFLAINPFLHTMIFIKVVGALFFAAFLFIEYFSVSKSNVPFLVFIFYLCIVDLGPYLFLFFYTV